MNCPICKSKPVVYVRMRVGKTLIDDSDGIYFPKYMVHCEFCESMETEWYEDREGAWEEWEQLCEEPNK